MLSLDSLNPQQRLAVETLNGPLLILAGAGTGKTRVISFRIGHMIANGIAPENILAVTFTNKAAREMSERLRTRKSASRDTRPTICTFHSLCVRILRKHIEKLGYKRNFVIHDESEQLSTIKRILALISGKGEKMEPTAILAQLSRLKNSGEVAGERRPFAVLKLAIRQHRRPWLPISAPATTRHSAAAMPWTSTISSCSRCACLPSIQRR
jgi:superfamily I DNA/RNA helicase